MKAKPKAKTKGKARAVKLTKVQRQAAALSSDKGRGKKAKARGTERGARSREHGAGKRGAVPVQQKAEVVRADKGLAIAEPGLLVARPCAVLEAGFVCVFDRLKKGPREFEGVPGFEFTKTRRFVVLYRPDPQETRVWSQPGKWVGTEDLGEARRWAEEIAAGVDKNGVLPVPPVELGGLTQRAFLFCEYVLAGKSQVEAYKLAGYTAKDPYAGASELAANPKVSQYLAAKRSAQVKRFTMTREDLLLWHKDVMDTPIGAIDEKHPLCQEYKVTSGENASVQYKMPGKMDAAKEIKSIMGWDVKEEEKEKADATVGALARVIVGYMEGGKK